MAASFGPRQCTRVVLNFHMESIQNLAQHSCGWDHGIKSGCKETRPFRPIHSQITKCKGEGGSCWAKIKSAAHMFKLSRTKHNIFGISSRIRPLGLAFAVFSAITSQTSSTDHSEAVSVCVSVLAMIQKSEGK